MHNMITSFLLGTLLLSAGFGNTLWGGELKAMQTRKTKDVVVTLLSESGQWTQGKNSFVLEFTSPSSQQPIDVGKVTLTTNMSMPGMAPMVADATLSPDKTPGRYLGTITFPDSGTRQVTVTWDGPAGKGSTRFSIPVR
jgi:YtkA-like